MHSKNLRLAESCPYLVVFLLISLGCGNGTDAATPPVEGEIASSEMPTTHSPVPDIEVPDSGTGFIVDCDVDLGLGPEDAGIIDFTDREQVWSAAWDGDALVLSRRYSCGDECSEEEILRIEDALAECPQQVVVQVTLRDRGEPDWTPQISEARDGSLTLQDWQVEKDGPLLVSGRVDTQRQFVFYLDTRGETAR